MGNKIDFPGIIQNINFTVPIRYSCQVITPIERSLLIPKLCSDIYLLTVTYLCGHFTETIETLNFLKSYSLICFI